MRFRAWFQANADKMQTEQNLQEEQRHRQLREARRAEERAQNQHVSLKSLGRESKTSYGHALFQNYGELYSQGINLFLAKKLIDPYTAGRHHQAWEFLLHFCGHGPRSIAVVVLTCVIDRISTTSEKKKLGKVIGKALQDELNGTVLHEEKGTVLLGLVRKKFGRKAVKPEVMRKLQVAPKKWTNEEKTELGCLCLDILMSSTQLIDERIAGRKLLIEPTDDVRELIRNQPPRALPIRQLPSLIPLEPWTDVKRGNKPLVSSRKPMDLSHIDAGSVGLQIQLVNGLESQAMLVDPWMAAVQREAWNSNLPLFPVRRDPGPEEPNLFSTMRRRARIEESLSQSEQVAGRSIWLDHDLDFRGRMYVSSRLVGHQGPDHSKGLVQFGAGSRCDQEGLEQMLMAAAGHYGLGKSAWSDRLEWGKANLHLMSAVAQEPLDRMDLWKDASDPWQFLQVAKAVNEWLLDPRKEMHVPIRFDQTCSGVGIISLLTRDRELARLTNCIGDCRSDVYSQVATDLSEELSRDLNGFDFGSARLAEIWLKHGITREVTKGPCMTSIYGARYFGIVDQLMEWLMEKNPCLDLEEWDREYVMPAQYLTRKMNLAIGHRLKSCVQVETWLRSVSKACMKRQQRIRFTTPMGFPVALGVEQEARQKVRTEMNGSKRWETQEACVIPGELSARATNRGITANVIHAFDASFCHAVVQTMQRSGLPVITNHDCFATLPSASAQLHRNLLFELREHYKPDWLTEIKEEIEENTGITLPAPPFVGDLCEGEIGNNPYVFS